MIVCVCNAVSDRHIRRAVAEGNNTLDALQFELGVGLQCGKCVGTACSVLEEARCSSAAQAYCHTLVVPLVHMPLPHQTQEALPALV